MVTFLIVFFYAERCLPCDCYADIINLIVDLINTHILYQQKAHVEFS